jgi:hypothetical protein
MLWMFWVVLIMLRYINDLYEIWDRNLEHDLSIILMSFIACCCWDLNCAKSWFRKWHIELLIVLWKYYLSLAWAWIWNIYCFEHKALGWKRPLGQCSLWHCLFKTFGPVFPWAWFTEDHWAGVPFGMAC